MVERIEWVRWGVANIHGMEWPACSPDLNPIEHLWGPLGRTLTIRSLIMSYAQCLLFATFRKKWFIFASGWRVVAEIAEAFVRCFSLMSYLRRL